ncbi:hypothetical protein FM107_16160 [Sphingobacterium sp. JB170]|nr:hypothetical protein FM107_16160 [Sphingobacterium sp. JB170]
MNNCEHTDQLMKTSGIFDPIAHLSMLETRLGASGMQVF